MKTLTLLALALLPLTSAFAEDCKSDALEIAKLNLDQVARKYGFDASEIGAIRSSGTIRAQPKNPNSEKLLAFTIDGSIYKGLYTVTVVTDLSCATRSVKIVDDFAAH
jgi:hypothetical protein